MLSGIRVVDLTRHLPGPYATWILAEHGADVVKVEAPPTGDPVRANPPHGPDGVSAAFRALNRGKRSAALDLKRPAGVEALARLLDGADVLVEGFRPGVLARLGLDPTACRERNPRLVTCSISGYGQDGPYRERPGHDLNYQAYAGALHVTADAAGRPVAPGLQSGDMSAAFAALTGILMALLERERTGRGRAVDASMLEALVSVQSIHLAAHVAGAPQVPGRMPLSGGLPSYGVYATRDGGAVALGILEPKFWRTFCEVVGRDDWLGRQLDPDVRGELEALFTSRTRDEWRVILENVDCCAAPVLDYDEVVDDPQARALGLIEAEGPTPPVRFEPPGRPGRGAPCPPRVGEHTRETLAEAGLREDEVEALLAGGAAVAPDPEA